MKIREISVNVSRTISFGHYEGAKVGVGLVASVEADEDSDIAFEELYSVARKKLQNKVEGLLR